MKISLAILSLVFVAVFELYTDAYLWRYVSDFIFSGMALQCTLLASFVWSVLLLWRALRSENMGYRFVKYMFWVCLLMGVWAGLCWGAFGLASLTVVLLLWVMPRILGRTIKNGESRITVTLLLQSLCVTGPIWFQMF